MKSPCFVFCAVLAGAVAAKAMTAPTIHDAIAFTRIQQSVAANGTCAAISPDGKLAVFVTWRGDPARNTNFYTLQAIRLEPGKTRTPILLLTRAFAGDPKDQSASPFSRIAFLPDSRTLVFLLRSEAEPAQVWTLDVETSVLRQLTRHATEVRTFALAADGSLLAYAAVAHADNTAALQRAEEDGVFLWDDELFPFRRPLMRSGVALATFEGREIRQYFIAGESGPEMLFDSRQSRPANTPAPEDPQVVISNPAPLDDEGLLKGISSLTLSPDGRRLLLFPYALTDEPLDAKSFAFYADLADFHVRNAARYGLVNLASGRIEPLLDAPHPWSGRETGEPLWSPDGDYVLIFTLQPSAPEAPPQWAEVRISDSRISTMKVPAGWKVVSWTTPGSELLLQKGTNLATIRRNDSGEWAEFTERGNAEGFNRDWPISVSGRTVIGVRDNLSSPPELAMFDLQVRTVSLLTDLNPWLRKRRLARIEPFSWATENEPDANGFLIKPLGYDREKRYPLVIYLDDGTLGRTDRPFIFDGVRQLSGFAAQTLAAEGFVVLYTREPHWRGKMGTTAEGPLLQAHIEAAVTKLDREVLIDPARIGISGWSRAGYYTHYLTIHSSVSFAAAITIDGGNVEYNDSMRPFTDAELSRVTTPLLFQPHRSPIHSAFMADRLAAMGKATEILWFKTASHTTTRPQHRFRSLDTHLDWWKFWLKDEESDDPAKAEQMNQWRKLREMRDADLAKAEPEKLDTP